MSDLTVNRTLVKSPPELWSELSEVESLARHLGEFGEISISRLEPEHTIAWEGEHARGTVELEAAGWGTKVTLSAELPASRPGGRAEDFTAAAEPVAREPAAEEADEPAPDEPTSAPRESRLRRWLFRQRGEAAIGRETPAVEIESVVAEPLAWYEPDPEGPEASVEAPAVAPGRAQAVLEDALESLGHAHHRPFSRG